MFENIEKLENEDKDYKLEYLEDLGVSKEDLFDEVYQWLDSDTMNNILNDYIRLNDLCNYDEDLEEE